MNFDWFRRCAPQPASYLRRYGEKEESILYKYRLYSLLIVSLYSPYSLAKDILDSSERWACVFPINDSGDKPTGNFYECKESGCNENAYKFYKHPETYMEVNNFIVDFNAKKVTYKWAPKYTSRAKRQSKVHENIEFIPVESKISINRIKKLTGYDGKATDTILTAEFEISMDVVYGNWEYSGNKLYFYAGGTKVLWSRVSSITFGNDQTMYTRTAYGQCRLL